MDLEQDNTEALIEELEVKLNRLRVIYEQYFLGIEKRPPSTLHKDVVRILFELEKRKPRKTAQKFKLRQLVQKFNSYRTYWSRICRQIEDGTYIKHKQKIQKKEASALKNSDIERNDDNRDEDLYIDKSKNDKNKEKLEEIKRKLGLQENQEKKEGININKIYDDLIAAKKKCNESVDKISADSLARSIEKQMPGLKEKYGTDNINFRVIVKDGKTYLKPYKE